MSKPEPEDGTTQDVDAMAKSRKWFHKQVEEAARRGDALCSDLLLMEQMGAPYYLGLDYDDDEDDFEMMEAF